MEVYFFKVNKDSSFTKDVEQYWLTKRHIRQSFEKVTEEFGLESTEYYLDTDRLLFKPTQADKAKLTTDILADGYTTRAVSKINKRWLELMNEMENKISRCPDFRFYFHKTPSEMLMSSRTMNDSFRLGSDWYLNVNMPKEFKENEVSKLAWLEEISGAEFYTLKEGRG